MNLIILYVLAFIGLSSCLYYGLKFLAHQYIKSIINDVPQMPAKGIKRIKMPSFKKKTYENNVIYVDFSKKSISSPNNVA